MKYHQTARYGLSVHTTRRHPLLRALAWAAVLAFAVYALLAFFGVAHAEERPYDPRRAAQRQEAFAVYVRASWCMQDASRAALSQGMRRQSDVEAFAAKMCGGQLRAFLMATPPKWAAADADALIKGMAVRAAAKERGEGTL